MGLIKDLFKGDKVIWVIFLFLCLISVVEVFSAASTLTYKSGDHWGPITQHSVMLIVGAFIVVLVHNIPCKWFSVLPFFLFPCFPVNSSSDTADNCERFPLIPKAGRASSSNLPLRWKPPSQWFPNAGLRS